MWRRSGTWNGRRVKSRGAKAYVNRIRERFPQNESDVYERFILLLRGYSSGNIDLESTINEVILAAWAYGQIKTLFSNQPDLIHDFIAFLPQNVRSGSKYVVDEPMPSPLPFPVSYSPTYMTMPIPVQNYTVSPPPAVQPPSPVPYLESVARVEKEEEQPFHLSSQDEHSLHLIMQEGGASRYAQFVKVCMLFARVEAIAWPDA